MNVRKVKLIALAMLAAVLSGLVSVPCFAATDLDDDSIYFKQGKSSTCTLVAMGMVFRRQAVIDGNENWDQITESSMKSQGNWPAGLAGSPKYKDSDNGLNMKATSKTLYSMRANSYKRNSDPDAVIDALKEQLDNHPEGIVLYIFKPVSKNSSDWAHAVALTGYDGDDFYCADPAGSSDGIINLEDSTLTSRYKANTKSVDKMLSYSVKIWYVYSSSNTSTDDDDYDVITKPTINMTRYPSTITRGRSFGLRGSVYSENNVTSIKGYVINSSGSTVMSTSDYPNSKSNDIRYMNLNEDMVFNRLSSGTYTLKVVAVDSSGGSSEWKKSFTVR